MFDFFTDKTNEKRRNAMKKRLRQLFSLCKFLLVWPWASLYKLSHKNIWLVTEDKYEARDNGYWIYKYIRENHPERKAYFAISRKSPDYEKIKKLGNVIEYDSVKHWFFYVASTCNISSQASGRPENGVAKFLNKWGFIRSKFCFLQHGVIINDLKWLYADRNKIDWFLTAAAPENEYIVNNFGYSKEQVKLLGLPRFDNLHDDITDESEILLMPTWRTWIPSSDRTIMNSAGRISDEKFEDSEYFKVFNSLLASDKLKALLKKYNKHILFYPHRNMQSFTDLFSADGETIKIAKREDYDVQELLRKCSILITDYSSVFMDVVYMKKPVLFYQFDEEKFRKGQYDPGYFDYANNPYSLWAKDEDALISNLENVLKNENAISYDIKELFPFHDAKNCERVYDSLSEMFDKK